jgi:hypothetical protein
MFPKFKILLKESNSESVDGHSKQCDTIITVMEAVSTSEMSVNFYNTIHRNIPEDSYLQCDSSMEIILGK